MTGLTLAAAFVAAAMVGFVVWGRRVDRANSEASEIQASLTRNYAVPRDVLFGRTPATVYRGLDGEWHPWTAPAPAPTPPPAVVELPPAEVAVIVHREEGAA
jgi:hypothetical protein